MKKTILSTLMAAGALAFATSASAAPVGNLFIDSSGNGVRVSATTIDWVPLGGPGGNMSSGFPTDVDYTDAANVAQQLSWPTPGTILDLPPVPLANFMTFQGHPDLAFHLAGLGPGSATDCGNPIGGFVASGACSFAGSPFVLTVLDATNTAIALSAFGLATDAVGSSTWDGSFTTQINKGISDIYDAIYGQGPGYVDSTYSGTFDVTLTPVPEPASMLLLGLGFGAAALGIRRRR